jgi:hypothetical protein
MTQSINPRPGLLKETEAAAILNVEVPTLRRWRWGQKGPAYVKIGACVRYHPADLEAFIEAGRRQSTGEVGRAA